MKRICTLMVAALALAGCRHDSFTIEGTIEGGANQTVWLEELAPDGPIFIDSIPLDGQGCFSYTYRMPYRSFYNLHTTADNYIVTLPDYGETVDVHGRWDNLSLSYTVEGSPESVLLWQLQQYTNEGARLLADLVDTTNHYQQLLQDGKVSQAAVDAKKHFTDSLYRDERDRQREYVYDFVDQNRGSLSTLIALYKTFNDRALINPRDSVGEQCYRTVREGLQERYPDNPHTRHFAQ